jgi:hypothetical protein
MVTKKIFKNVILTLFALNATVMMLVIVEEILYPINEDISFTWVDVAGIIITFSYILSLFLLYKFKAIGKKLFVTSFILLFIILLFSGDYWVCDNYSSLSPIITIVDLLCYVVVGMILSILYFTSIKKEFE